MPDPQAGGLHLWTVTLERVDGYHRAHYDTVMLEARDREHAKEVVADSDEKRRYRVVRIKRSNFRERARWRKHQERNRAVEEAAARIVKPAKPGDLQKAVEAADAVERALEGRP